MTHNPFAAPNEEDDPTADEALTPLGFSKHVDVPAERLIEALHAGMVACSQFTPKERTMLPETTLVLENVFVQIDPVDNIATFLSTNKYMLSASNTANAMTTDPYRVIEALGLDADTSFKSKHYGGVFNFGDPKKAIRMIKAAVKADPRNYVRVEVRENELAIISGSEIVLFPRAHMVDNVRKQMTFIVDRLLDGKSISAPTLYLDSKWLPYVMEFTDKGKGTRIVLSEQPGSKPVILLTSEASVNKVLLLMPLFDRTNEPKDIEARTTVVPARPPKPVAVAPSFADEDMEDDWTPDMYEPTY